MDAIAVGCISIFTFGIAIIIAICGYGKKDSDMYAKCAIALSIIGFFTFLLSIFIYTYIGGGIFGTR